MTAIYVPPPQQVQSTASVSFSGMLEATSAENVAITQKAVFLDHAARIVGAWISGVDGIDPDAAGQTVIHVSDRPYDQQGTDAQGFDLILAAGECRTVASGEIAIPAESWLYVFITQADGGHYGAQTGLNIQWEE